MMENDKLLQLPMDIIEQILSDISDPASLVRVASTCKSLRNLIKDQAFLDCLQRQRYNHGFAPSLLLGFFYQDSSESPLHALQHDKDKRHGLGPSFMPTSELSQFIGSIAGCNGLTRVTLDSFMHGLGASLNFYEPIASQDGFLALRRNSKLYVCNPLTGWILDVPPFPGDEQPDRYALLITEDVSPEGWTYQSFQLVAICFRGTRICDGWSYSSKNKRWSRLGSIPALLPGIDKVQSPAAASHGAIHFLSGNSINWTLTHVVTLHVATRALSYLKLPLAPNCSKGNLLGNSADGGLLLLLLEDLQLSLWKHDSKLGSGPSSWVLSETIDLARSLPLKVVEMQHRSRIILEIFLGKSGAVVLRVEGEGLFLFSLSNGSMRKIDHENGTKRYSSLCPCEIDWLSCLAIMNLVVDGSLTCDVGRKKIQSRRMALRIGEDICE